MIIHTIWSLPYHDCRISNKKLLSQIFSATPAECPHQISLQHMIHNTSVKNYGCKIRTNGLVYPGIELIPEIGQ